MREELLGPIVEGVAFAVVQQFNEENEKVYNVYLINLREDIMEGIIVTSQGYGKNVTTGETTRTSKLRHSLELLLPNEAAKIEPIIEEVFGLSNEYWISFWVNDVLYDKKFVFVAESISEENMKILPIIGEKGVMIK
ncbi:MAG: hypothetical protein HRT58_03505 [Crocinitomicaceae bacterium]|nr:hypothetical protein [Flavobacteriales bacterium]NQZ34699.1 hypothetical protein [Crocinitomicaceae bacterium]